MHSDRKRVLFLVPAFAGGAGGPERVISTLLRHLDHARFECHLAKAQTGHAYLDNIPRSVVVHELNVSRMRYALPAIARLIRKLQPQTVLSAASHLNVNLVLAKPFLPRGIRLVLREETTPSAFLVYDTAYPRIRTWLYQHLYPRAEKIVCLSESILEEMTSLFGIPREKLVRIYNPVDILEVQCLAETQASPYTGPGPNLVVAGRLRPEKAIDILLKAMPAVIQAFPDAKLTILGEGPQEQPLREQAQDLGVSEHVGFRGFEQNPWPYLGHADLFVLPSRFEGMPNSLLEALALGTPVVATDSVRAMREIKEYNQHMVLVPPEDPFQLAQGLISALRQPRAGRGSPALVAERLHKFSVEQVVGQYSCLL